MIHVIHQGHIENMYNAEYTYNFSSGGAQSTIATWKMGWGKGPT